MRSALNYTIWQLVDMQGARNRARDVVQDALDVVQSVFRKRALQEGLGDADDSVYNLTSILQVPPQITTELSATVEVRCGLLG